MKRLLRILYTIRGLILAGTLMTAAIGSYLDRGTALSVNKVNGHRALQVQAMGSSQVPPPWRIGDPCPVAACFHYLDRGQVPLQWRVSDPCSPVSTPASAPLCWSAPGTATIVPAQSLCTTLTASGALTLPAHCTIAVPARCTPSPLPLGPDIACDDR